MTNWNASSPAGVNVKDKKEKTPLHLAAEKGHRETIIILLKK